MIWYYCWIKKIVHQVGCKILPYWRCLLTLKTELFKHVPVSLQHGKSQCICLVLLHYNHYICFFFTMLQQIALRDTVAVRGTDLCGWGYGQVVGCCEHGNELLGSIKCGDFLNTSWSIGLSRWTVLREIISQKMNLLQQWFLHCFISLLAKYAHSEGSLEILLSLIVPN
jgi:hypothetical protein